MGDLPGNVSFPCCVTEGCEVCGVQGAGGPWLLPWGRGCSGHRSCTGSSASVAWHVLTNTSQTPSEGAQGAPALLHPAVLTNTFRRCTGNPSSAFSSFFFSLGFEILMGTPGMVSKCPMCEVRQKAIVLRTVFCLVVEFHVRK